MSNIIMLCSQYEEIAVSCAFFAGAYATPAPGAGYDPVRCDAGAWMSVAVYCQAFFRRNVRLLLPLFWGMSNQIFRRTSPQLGYCRSLLSQFTIPQTPQFFILKKIISLSPLKGNRALLKITVQNDKKISYFLVFSVDIFNFWYKFMYVWFLSDFAKQKTKVIWKGLEKDEGVQGEKKRTI